MTSTDWIVSSANRTLKTGILELIQNRAVLYALVKRETKSRYRGSFLGFAWALGKPISMLLVFSLVVGEILGASRSIEFFALYLFVGLMIWGFFSEAVVAGTNSIISASGLVQKIAFPREILPLAAVINSAVNTLIQVPVLMVGYLIFRTNPKFDQFVFLLPLILILVFLTLGLALTLSAVNVYIRDVQPLTELLMMLLMYTTPVIYSWTFVKEKVIESFESDFIFEVYSHNPLAVIITGFQDVLWPGERVFSSGEIAPQLFSFTSLTIWMLVLISFLFLIFSYRIFLKLEPNFAREL